MIILSAGRERERERGLISGKCPHGVMAMSLFPSEGEKKEKKRDGGDHLLPERQSV